MTVLMLLALCLVYAAPLIVGFRPLTGHFAWGLRVRDHEHDLINYPSITSKRIGRPSGEQWFGAGIMAFLVLAVWPCSVLVWFAGRKVPLIGYERLGHLQAARERIAELERELELDR